MALQVYRNKNTSERVPAGIVTLTKAGRAYFHEDDLKYAGLDGHATLLFDAETKVLALRRPLDGEAPVAVWKNPPHGNHRYGRRIVPLAGAMKKMGYDRPGRVEALAGQHRLHRKNNALLIFLSEAAM